MVLQVLLLQQMVLQVLAELQDGVVQTVQVVLQQLHQVFQEHPEPQVQMDGMVPRVHQLQQQVQVV